MSLIRSYLLNLAEKTKDAAAVCRRYSARPDSILFPDCTAVKRRSVNTGTSGPDFHNNHNNTFILSSVR